MTRYFTPTGNQPASYKDAWDNLSYFVLFDKPVDIDEKQSSVGMICTTGKMCGSWFSVYYLLEQVHAGNLREISLALLRRKLKEGCYD